MVSPAAKREAATWLVGEYEVSQRRACRTLGLGLSTCCYVSRRVDGGEVRKRLVELAEERLRLGYRRLWLLLRREGHEVNPKRVYRLYRLGGLKLRPKKRKRVSRHRQKLVEPKHVNDRWSMDFMSDQLAQGRRFRILNVVDDCSREALASEAEYSLPGVAVVDVLDAVAALRGYPKQIVIDNGPEFTGRRLDYLAPRKGRRAPIHEARQTVTGHIRRKLQRLVSR